ncbi:MAG: DUF433 domain-containing protein [Candidatus Heimdallarchaeota archaeon]|nr:DUF433 domain-containing protein [Candidatus Heimdallarchaeota archaeon]
MSESRITIDSEICHGKPCIKGTRIPVYLILEMLEHGLNFDQILEEYPQLEIEDLKACLEFAKRIINNEEISPIVETGLSA